MSGRATGRQGGFTILEVLIAVAVAMLAVAAGTETLTTANLLATHSRLHLRASAAYRDAQAAVGAELRNAAIDTLAGFDPSGATSQLRFRQVTGIAGSGVEHGPEHTLAYRLQPGVVAGVPDMGDVEVGDIVLRTTGQPDAVLARKVVRGSFAVRQEGRALIVQLAILHGQWRSEIKHVKGHTVVSLRN